MTPPPACSAAPDVILAGIAVGLAVLHHDVQDIFPTAPDAADGLADAVNRKFGMMLV